MPKLNKMLADWVADGIIGIDQSRKIEAYEARRPAGSWVLYGFMSLGVLIFGIGVVSLIAANWRGIPDGVKLGADFVLLAAVAAGAYAAWERQKPILFEGVLTLFLVLCLASIGLISQVYHTGGELYEALLFWAVITAGVMMASRRSVVPMLWACGFFGALIATGIDAPALKPYFRHHEFVLFMIIPLLSAVLAVLSRTLSGDSGQTRAFRTWTVMAGVAGLIVAEFQREWKPAAVSGSVWVGYGVGYGLAVLTAAGIRLSREYRTGQQAVLLIVLMLFLLDFHLSRLGIRGGIVPGGFTIVVLALMAVFFASLKKRRLFNMLLVFMGIRFLVLYFQALGGLATTGLGLIVSGAVILAAVALWHRYRQTVARWAEGLV